MDINISDHSFILWRKKIPELMHGIGRGIKEFNGGKENVKKKIDNDVKKG